MLAATASSPGGPPWEGTSNGDISSGDVAADSIGRGHRSLQQQAAAGALLFVSGSHPVRGLPGVSR